MAALAAITSHVRVILTVHTLLQHPAVTARMVATLDQVSRGPAGLNVVTGSYKGEFEQMRMCRDHVDHDKRYDLANEWTHVIQRLWREESVDFNGRYFIMRDCQSDLKPAQRPLLVCAGTSEKSIRFTAERMDAMFAGGRSDEEITGISTRVKAIARPDRRTIRTYSMPTLVIGESDAAAEAKAEYYRSGFDEKACFGMMRAYGFLDVEIGRENAFLQSARSGFMSARITGSAATVAIRMIDLMETCSLNGMMLIFPDYLKCMSVFVAEIMPRICNYSPEMAHAA